MLVVVALQFFGDLVLKIACSDASCSLAAQPTNQLPSRHPGLSGLTQPDGNFDVGMHSVGSTSCRTSRAKLT